eukprot:s3438_g5.t1
MGGFDVLGPLRNQLKRMCKSMRVENFSFHHLAFDVGKGRPYDIQGFITVLRGLLEPLVQNVDSMSSYSLRRASPTVAALAELTEPEKVALGGWLEKGQNVAVSAARYNAEKMRQCEQLRLALRYTLDVVTAGYQPSVWRELLSGCVPAGHGVG